MTRLIAFLVHTPTRFEGARGETPRFIRFYMTGNTFIDRVNTDRGWRAM